LGVLKIISAIDVVIEEAVLTEAAMAFINSVLLDAKPVVQEGERNLATKIDGNPD
jgi:hypothetical protein